MGDLGGADNGAAVMGMRYTCLRYRIATVFAAHENDYDYLTALMMSLLTLCRRRRQREEPRGG